MKSLIPAVSLRVTKNGGDSGSEILSKAIYADAQKVLAAKVSEHIAKNSFDQQIAEVIIIWKAPIEREYSYKIEPIG